jgi:hypothetical protein
MRLSFRRRRPYFVIAAVAVVLCVGPALLLLDLLAFDREFRAQGRATGTSVIVTWTDMPARTRTEMRLFTALVVPPAIVAHLLRGHWTTYFSLTIANNHNSGEGYCSACSLSAAFLENTAFALPLWLCLGAVLFETVSAARRVAGA